MPAWRFLLASAVSLFCSANVYAADDGSAKRIERIVDAVVRPMMAENDVPGMAVAVTIRGERYVFNYGLASKESGKTVDDDTIFEIGSVSKTFTATLGSYAEASGTLSLSDKASRSMPELAGTAFDGISLLELSTYTAGGLPLQFPDDVTDPETMIGYYRNWRPTYAAGTQRQYSNASIGLFGHLAAKSMGKPFAELMEGKLFPALGLAHTYIKVPKDQMANYAFGYSKAGEPIRVTPGVLDAEAYGVKTTASDMIRFVEANMDGAGLDDTLRRAIDATHAGYFSVGGMTQGLGWEMYADPADLDALLAGNSTRVILEANPAARLDPPQPLRPGVLVNKTGSTNGFGTYVAFVPSQRTGVVMLANRNYPIPVRVKAGYDLLMALDDEP